MLGKRSDQRCPFEADQLFLGRFPKQDFEIDLETFSCTCPVGHVTTALHTQRAMVPMVTSVSPSALRPRSVTSVRCAANVSRLDGTGAGL